MNFEENIIDALADNKEKNRKLCSKACSFLTSEKRMMPMSLFIEEQLNFQAKSKQSNDDDNKKNILFV